MAAPRGIELSCPFCDAVLAEPWRCCGSCGAVVAELVVPTLADLARAAARDGRAEAALALWSAVLAVNPADREAADGQAAARRLKRPPAASSQSATAPAMTLPDTDPLVGHASAETASSAGGAVPAGELDAWAEADGTYVFSRKELGLESAPPVSSLAALTAGPVPAVAPSHRPRDRRRLAAIVAGGGLGVLAGIAVALLLYLNVTSTPPSAPGAGRTVFGYPPTPHQGARELAAPPALVAELPRQTDAAFPTPSPSEVPTTPPATAPPVTVALRPVTVARTAIPVATRQAATPAPTTPAAPQPSPPTPAMPPAPPAAPPSGSAADLIARAHDLLERGRAEDNDGLIRDAIRVLEAVDAKAGAAYFQALLMAGETYQYELSLPTDAESVYGKILRKEPGHPIVYYHLAKLLLLGRRHAECLKAAGDFRTNLNVNPAEIPEKLKYLCEVQYIEAMCQSDRARCLADGSCSDLFAPEITPQWELGESQRSANLWDIFAVECCELHKQCLPAWQEMAQERVTSLQTRILELQRHLEEKP
ncbi:MAG: hypothetical protein HYV63_14540 [Candidatus Schekmanbacteria bacterium]|nr:hypothetical protein [Candidatus Schekmanbacteria bacterium]